MTREQFQEKYKLSLPLKTRKEFEAARRRMGALTKDEKAILSAIVLKKGEAEAGEIFANSPERLRDYTILKGVNSYAALGRYYLANETTVPEELYEYMGLPLRGRASRRVHRQRLCAVSPAETGNENEVIPS